MLAFGHCEITIHVNIGIALTTRCGRRSAFAASLDGALSPMVGPGYVLLAKQFDVSVDNIASSFGFILLGLGTFMYEPTLFYLRIARSYTSQACSKRTGSEVRAQNRLSSICVFGKSFCTYIHGGTIITTR